MESAEVVVKGFLLIDLLNNFIVKFIPVISNFDIVVVVA